MRKNFIVFFISVFLLSTNIVEAKTLKVTGKTLNDFSTIEKTENLKIEILGTHQTPNNNYIPAGTIISGKVTKFIEPKRIKRDAYAYLKIDSYKLAHENDYKSVKNPDAVVKISKYKKLDVKEKSLDIGASAAGLLIENITYPINFVRGVVSAEKGENRLKAGAEMTYEKSVLSYASKGKELVVPTGSLLTVTLTYESEKKPRD